MEYDFAELVRQYGVEYMEENNMYDEMPNEMEMLNEYTQYDALEAITRAFYGYRWSGVEKDEREEFNPNDEYFAFNAYGNLISIPDYWYDEYLQSFIGEDEFIEWCQEQGYIDEDDDEDEDEENIDGVSGVRVDNEWGANEMYLQVMNTESLYNKYRDYLFKHANTQYYKEYVKKYARMLQNDIKYGRIYLQPGMGHGEQARMMAGEELYNAFSSEWLHSQVK